MVGEVGKAKIMALEKLGEDEIFERIASGVSLASIKREFNICLLYTSPSPRDS